MTAAEKPAQREGVEDLHLETAKDLLEFLRPTNPRWAPDPTKWIYRGIGNAKTFSLTASGLRDASVFRKFGIVGDASGWSNRVPLVDKMLRRFGRGLDQSGIVIPTVPPTEDAEYGSRSRAEPDRKLFPLMALAQHHRLPTLLLDWTHRGPVAAYFAASVCEAPGDHIAVYALELTESLDRRFGLDSGNGTIEIYKPPGGTNPNLRAQSGLFTLAWGPDDPSIEEILVRARKKFGEAPRLVRATLPLQEAPKLLELLSHEGVTGASMFPGADGVVQAMREEGEWAVKRDEGGSRDDARQEKETGHVA